MKYFISTLVALLLSWNVSAANLAGIELPEQLQLDSPVLKLNGSGVRHNFFMEIYAAGLYLQATSSQAKQIVASDEAMALRLHVTSRLLTAKRMESATREGFEKSTTGNTAAIQKDIDVLINTFKDGIKKNDTFDFIYQPKLGLKVYKNNELKTQIKGLAFKQALWGIWLSETPVEDDLKAGLLGQF